MNESGSTDSKVRGQLEVSYLVKTAGMGDPHLLDELLVFLTLFPLLLRYPVQDYRDLLLTVTVGTVVCAAHNAMKQLQIMPPNLMEMMSHNIQPTIFYFCRKSTVIKMM